MSKQKSVSPEFGKPAFDCPNCGAFAHQEWASLGREIADPEGDYFLLLATGHPLFRQVPAGLDEAMEHLAWLQRSRWNASRCASCNEWSIWMGPKLVHPRLRVGGTPHPEMPREVRELFEEAAAVAAVSPRAGAAFARVTVERLLKTLFPETTPRLELLIAEAKQRGVSAAVGKMLDVVRVTGNDAVHVDEQPGDLVVLVLDEVQGPGLVGKLLQAVNDLVEQLITLPREAEELNRLIPESIRARIDKLSPPAGQQ